MNSRDLSSYHPTSGSYSEILDSWNEVNNMTDMDMGLLLERCLQHPEVFHEMPVAKQHMLISKELQRRGFDYVRKCDGKFHVPSYPVHRCINNGYMIEIARQTGCQGKGFKRASCRAATVWLCTNSAFSQGLLAFTDMPVREDKDYGSDENAYDRDSEYFMCPRLYESDRTLFPIPPISLWRKIRDEL